MEYKYILISLFLIISIGLSNQSNGQSIEENEIKCFYGTEAEYYLINNSQNHKFLILIKRQKILLIMIYIKEIIKIKYLHIIVHQMTYTIT